MFEKLRSVFVEASCRDLWYWCICSVFPTGVETEPGRQISMGKSSYPWQAPSWSMDGQSLRPPSSFDDWIPMSCCVRYVCCFWLFCIISAWWDIKVLKLWHSCLGVFSMSGLRFTIPLAEWGMDSINTRPKTKVSHHFRISKGPKLRVSTAELCSRENCEFRRLGISLRGLDITLRWRKGNNQIRGVTIPHTT